MKEANPASSNQENSFTEYSFNKDKKTEIISELRTRAKKYIRYEILNLIIVLILTAVIVLFVFYEIKYGITPAGTNDSVNKIVSNSMFKIVIVLIFFFLIRIFLNFQVYNTKRASYVRSIAVALDLYDGNGDFQKLVDIMTPYDYSSIDKLPDDKLKDFISFKFKKP